MQAAQLRTLARRALARARAERSAAREPGGAQDGGGHALSQVRPPAEPLGVERVLAAGLLAADDLTGLARGTRLRLGPGVRITPLARDEAWRRGILLLEVR